MLDIKAISKNFKALRVTHHLSQEQLAQKLYVSHQAVSRWEQGKGIPSIETLLMFKNIFNVSIESLLCLNEPLPSNTDDLFQNHSRLYIIDRVIKGADSFIFEDILHKLTQEERYYALSKILTHHYPINLLTLWSRLSYGERRQIILHYNEQKNSKALKPLLQQMTKPEKQLMKEGM